MGSWTRVRLCALCSLVVLMPTIAGCAPRIGYAPTPQPVTIRFAYREQTVELDTIMGQFHEKYPWITIELVETQRFGNDMDSLLLAGNLDVFQGDREALRFVEQGLLAPLDDIQLGDWSSIRDDYYDGAWEGLAIQGQQWGVPAGLDMLVAYINMDQANALAVEAPDETWTQLDFVELTSEMNFPEGLPHSESARLWGFCSDPTSMDPFVFIYLNGGRVVDDINSPSEALLDHPSTVEAVQFYSDLFNAYQVAPFPDVVRAAFRRDAYYEAAVRGACGVWVGWYSNRGGQDTRWEWDLAWKMLPLPRGRDEITLGDVQGYYILKDSEHPQEILLFLRFLAGHWEAAGTKLPPRRSLVTSKEYEQQVGEEIVATAARVSNRIIMLPAGDSPALNTVGAELLASVQLILNEDLSAGQVLGEAQQRVKNVFEGQ